MARGETALHLASGAAAKVESLLRVWGPLSGDPPACFELDAGKARALAASLVFDLEEVRDALLLLGAVLVVGGVDQVRVAARERAE